MTANLLYHKTQAIDTEPLLLQPTCIYCVTAAYLDDVCWVLQARARVCHDDKVAALVRHLTQACTHLTSAGLQAGVHTQQQATMVTECGVCEDNHVHVGGLQSIQRSAAAGKNTCRLLTSSGATAGTPVAEDSILKARILR
jgi:hypothetical protein